MVLWRCYRLLTDKPLLPQLIAHGSKKVRQAPVTEYSQRATIITVRMLPTLLALSAFAMMAIGRHAMKPGKTVPVTHSQKQRTTGKIPEWPT